MLPFANSARCAGPWHRSAAGLVEMPWDGHPRAIITWRPGVSCHDGGKLNTADAADSLQHAIDPKAHRTRRQQDGNEVAGGSSCVGVQRQLFGGGRGSARHTACAQPPHSRTRTMGGSSTCQQSRLPSAAHAIRAGVHGFGAPDSGIDASDARRPSPSIGRERAACASAGPAHAGIANRAGADRTVDAQ